MPLGLTPRTPIQIPLDNLTPEQFIMLAADIATKLGWGIYFINATGLTATTSEVPFMPRERVLLQISNSVAYLKSQPTGAKMPTRKPGTKYEFPGRNERGASIQEFASRLEAARQLYTPEELYASFERNRANMAPPDQDVSSQQSRMAKEGWRGLADSFIPRKGYFITPIIIDLNILIFLLMVLSGVSWIDPDRDSLIAWGANDTDHTLNGQWWRLITSTFLHIGIFHLLFNMYAFSFIGQILEPYLGRWKFAITYLLTGIIASATSIFWHKTAITGAGASGAIFGMTGLLLSLLTTNLMHPEKRKPLLRSIGLFVLYNLAFGAAAGGGIDNSAHIGGLVSGLLFGYILYPLLKRKPATDLPA